MEIEIDININEEEIKKINQKIVNRVGESAHKEAIEHIKNTYNTAIDNSSFRITKATKNDLTYKIKVKGRRVNLIKKVVSVTKRGVKVKIKKDSPKFIRSAFVAPWQKGQSKRWLFISKGKKRRRALYTIGIVGMYKSRATMKVIDSSIDNTIKKIK